MAATAHQRPIVYGRRRIELQIALDMQPIPDRSNAPKLSLGSDSAHKIIGDTIALYGIAQMFALDWLQLHRTGGHDEQPVGGVLGLLREGTEREI